MTTPANQTVLDQATVDKLKAQEYFHRQNGRAAEIIADQELVNLRMRLRAEEEELSRDKYHHVYVFDNDVEDVSVKECRRQLTSWHRGDPACDVEIQLNSPGGDVFAGLSLIDYLLDFKRRGHYVRIIVHGHAASMAAAILQAGNERIMGANAFLLVHEGSAEIGGSLGDIEDSSKLIEKLQSRLVSIMAERSTMSERQLRTAFSRKNWWLNAQECLEKGFVDTVQ